MAFLGAAEAVAFLGAFLDRTEIVPLTRGCGFPGRGVLSAGAFIVSRSWRDVGLPSGDRASRGNASCAACSEFSTKVADCAASATALLATPPLPACQRWEPSSAISREAPKCEWFRTCPATLHCDTALQHWDGFRIT